uniref:Small G protein signalling modulator 1/2 Rab-binding domain-containing protein n=1 Tax=Romanomermis culicivorax TaxID=13658 RepID=A0A915KFI7_ROMCU
MTQTNEHRNSHKNLATSFPFSPHERPSIQIKRKVNLSIKRKASSSMKDCVFSLHQNSNLNILYAKNNIRIYTTDDKKSISGYLSLLQNSITGQISIRWVPNQLINDSDISNQHNNNEEEGELYLTKLRSYVFSINIAEMAYLHCHNKCDSSKEHSLVFVAGDGVHFTPIYFPPGGHLFTFLSNMESGLWPHYRLEPPLYTQK